MALIAESAYPIGDHEIACDPVAGDLFGFECSFDRTQIADGAEVELQFFVSADGNTWEPFGPSALFVGGKLIAPDGNLATTAGFGFSHTRFVYDPNTKLQTGVAAPKSDVQTQVRLTVRKADVSLALDTAKAPPFVPSGPLGHQSISYVQVATCSVNAGSSMTSTGMTTTSGNLLHIDCQVFNTIESPTSDTYSNTFTEINRNTGYNSSWTQTQFYAKNITGGASHTVTWNTVYGHMAVVEIAGANTTAPLDKSAKSTSNTVASGTTTQANELIVACGVRTDGNTETKDAALTLISDFSITGRTTERLNNGYQIVSATGSYSYTTTSAQSSMVATYKEAAGGGGGSVFMPAVSGIALPNMSVTM